MPSEFVKVYDLREAPHNIAEVERTLNFRRSEGHKEVLIPAQLTPGSPGWWEAMESGLIRVYTAEGVITAIYDVEGSRMGDIYYAFDVDEGHRKSTWDMLSNQGRDELYRQGNSVRVRYPAALARGELGGRGLEAG